MNNWKTKQLGIICKEAGGNIQTGPFGSQLHQSDYIDIGIPVIMPKDIIHDKIDLLSASRIAPKLAEKLKRHRLKLNDILFPRRGDINKRVLIEQDNIDSLCGTGCLKIEVPVSELVPKFLYFYLKQLAIVEWIVNQSIGATMENLNSNTLKKLLIKYPPLLIQNRIVSILSAYDELIEVNNQRIKILEDTASQIYKEWFVRMRFPGYKKTKFEKGIPDGWNVTKIADAFDILGGGTPSTEKEEFWNGYINWFTPTDITGSSSIFLKESSNKISETGLKQSSAKIFPPYSIMMTSRATIGAVGINTTTGCTNQGFITCLPNELLPYTFLYYWISFNKETFEMLASGSTFLEITKGTFKKIKIIVPKIEIVANYHEITRPIFNQIENLSQQITELRQIRDRLLPRLISGILQIKEPEQTGRSASQIEMERSAFQKAKVPAR